MPERRVKGMFEKHLQSFLLGLLSLLVVWFGQRTIQTREDVIALRGEVRALKSSVGTEDRAENQLRELQHRYFENSVNENSARISLIEERLNLNRLNGSHE